MPTQTQIDAEFQRMNADDERKGKALTEALQKLGVAEREYKMPSATLKKEPYRGFRFWIVPEKNKLRTFKDCEHFNEQFVGEIDLSATLEEQKAQLEKAWATSPTCDWQCEETDEDGDEEDA